MPEPTVKPKRPVILVHGYSDRGESFFKWGEVLKSRGFDATVVGIVTYKSLTNEVTIKDLAEGFDRALKIKGINGEFDAIVHSTGMLVVRAWLTATRDTDRRRRLKHLIGFAPASWGSPLAHKGRGWLGAIFKGNKERGPDFLEAGDLILDGLELASRFTWDLAHRDLFAREEDAVFGKGPDTPYPFIFCGNEDYKDLFRRVVNEPGTDGTVRFAGVALNSRKLVLDLTKSPDDPARVSFVAPSNLDCPVVFVNGRNHGSIISDPDPTVAKYIFRALLEVESAEQYRQWQSDAAKEDFNRPPKKAFQQFVIRLTDERGDPINDYNLQLFHDDDGKAEELPDFDLDVHPYKRDPSLRCFHVELEKLKGAGRLWARLTISSGTILVGYRGVSSKGFVDDPPAQWKDENEKDYFERIDARPLEVNLDLGAQVQKIAGGTAFFFPWTTTLIEMKVDREPLPANPDKLARLCEWAPWK
jgi:pimeloyl-ACP methyl ester carboxylesterase